MPEKELPLHLLEELEHLTLLAGDANVSVRWGVATNPHTPAKTLTILSRDADSSVRWEVAANPSTPKS